ncbi:hypothetical protein [Euzebya sp.]|uniref:hypothetical protein n=1 Tax=Euzebya sp. TaxID=1971409 RepID=UPI003515DC20
MADTPRASAGPGPADVAAHLEALNLAGLGFAAKRLLGREPERVTQQFTMWARQDLPGLPSLTASFWAAIGPLGAGRPRTTAAALCDQVLRGREGDAAVAGRAAADCATASRAQYARAPLDEAEGDSSLEARQRRALVKAVKNYWRAVGHVYGEVRVRVISGEHDRAERMVRKAEQALAELVERIAVASRAVAAHAPADAAPADAAPADPTPASAAPADPAPHETYLPEPERIRSPLGDTAQMQTRAEAFARAERIREDLEEEPEPLPVEVLSTKPVPNRIIAPIVFLLGIAGLALFVIFQVLNAPNPLAQ